jgi:hypothetical protein
MVCGFSNKKLISVEDYSMIFKLHGKRRYNTKTMKDERAIVVDTTKRLMSFPKCKSVEVINNPARPGSNH